MLNHQYFTLSKYSQLLCSGLLFMSHGRLMRLSNTRIKCLLGRWAGVPRSLKSLKTLIHLLLSAEDLQRHEIQSFCSNSFQILPRHSSYIGLVQMVLFSHLQLSFFDISLQWWVPSGLGLPLER